MSDLVIQQPDTAEVSTQVVNLEKFLELKITDRDGLLRAKEGLDAVANQKPIIKQLFQDAKQKAKEALDSINTLEDSFLAPLKSIDEYLRGEVRRFLDAQAAAAEALQKRLQAEADKRAQDEAAKQEEDRDPWDAPETIALAPRVIVAPPPKIIGLGLRKTPARAIVKDKKALILAAADGLLAGNDSWLEYLDADLPILSARARQLGKEEFEKRYPGCEFFQGETVARR